MRVRWLTRAIESLIAARNYIAQDNPKAAEEFFRYVIVSTTHLEQYPQIGRTGRVHGTRELVLVKYPYIVPYRVKGQEVQILRVLHSARIWPSGF
jgi:addiction module RelE/StbE family toxin